MFPRSSVDQFVEMVDPITAIKYVPLCVIYVLAHLVPKDESIRIYGYNQGTSFTDNSKYLYLYANRNGEDTRDVWYSRNDELVRELREEGYEAYSFDSIRGWYVALRAKYTFITHNRKDVPWWLTGGTTAIRLGHGIPFKRYGYDEEQRIAELSGLKLLAYRLFLRKYHYTIATSPSQAKNVASATRMSIDRVWVTGLPRMDALAGDIAGEDIWCADEPAAVEERSGSVLFYFPTWRRSRASFPPQGVFEAVDRILVETDSVLITRNHPSGSKLDSSTFERIHALPPTRDFYPILRDVDVFLTDYSSLFYDALYRDARLLFFPHDYESYTNSRDFYFDYFDLPGEIVTTDDAFVDAVAAAITDDGVTETDPTTRRWLERTFDSRDDDNCERVMERVRGL